MGYEWLNNKTPHDCYCKLYLRPMIDVVNNLKYYFEIKNIDSLVVNEFIDARLGEIGVVI